MSVAKSESHPTMKRRSSQSDTANGNRFYNVSHSSKLAILEGNSQSKQSKSKWNMLFSNVYCHGLPDVSSADSVVLKAIWILLFLVFLIILLGGIVKSSIEYYKNPIVTSSSYQPKKFIDFPLLYVCPVEFIVDSMNLDDRKRNRYEDFLKQMIPAQNKSKVIHADTSIWNMAKANLPLDPDLLPPSPSCVCTNASSHTSYDLSPYHLRYYDCIHSDVPIYIQSFASNDTICSLNVVELPEPTRLPPLNYRDQKTASDLIDDMGIATNQFMEECTFRSKRFSCSDNVTSVIDTTWSKCFLVNITEQQVEPGQGLIVFLNLDPLRPGYGNEAQMQGPWVRISQVFEPYSSEQLLLSWNKYIKIALEAEDVTLINNLRSEEPQRCTDGKHFQVFKLPYSVSTCRSDCYQSEALPICGCLLPIDVSMVHEQYRHLPYCTANETQFCMQPLIYSLLEEANPNSTRYAKCINSCHKPCHYRNIRKSVTYTNAFVYDEYRSTRSATILDVSFNQIDVSTITQRESMTMITLVSNIGGQLGLWIGASLITVFQVMMFCFRVYCIPLISKRSQ